MLNLKFGDFTQILTESNFVGHMVVQGTECSNGKPHFDRHVLFLMKKKNRVSYSNFYWLFWASFDGTLTFCKNQRKKNPDGGSKMTAFRK